MEGFMNIWINYFYNYQRKYVILKDFSFIINKYNEKEKNYNLERVLHVKYLNVIQNKENLEIRYLKEETIYLKIENEDDILNWVDAIINAKSKYEKFLDEYYINNNSERLFNFQKSESYNTNSITTQFSQFFNNTLIFIQKLESDLYEITINLNLDNILLILNNFISLINNYSSIIEKYFVKLNSSNSNEYHFINKSKEIKTLFDELKDSIVTITYGLNQSEINSYIIKFKENLLKKITDIKLIIKEIEYLMENYIRVYLNSTDVDEGLEKNNELSKLILENELVNIKINHLNTETDIIKQFMNDYS